MMRRAMAKCSIPSRRMRRRTTWLIARFLRTCPGLSKSIVGDLLGQNTERCLRILDAFTHMFDFSGAASQSLCCQVCLRCLKAG